MNKTNMPPRQNALKRNIISFALAFTTAMVAMSIQQSKQKDLLIIEKLEASVLPDTPILVAE